VVVLGSGLQVIQSRELRACVCVCVCVLVIISLKPSIAPYGSSFVIATVMTTVGKKLGIEKLFNTHEFILQSLTITNV
jgi:hypothetical protein